MFVEADVEIPGLEGADRVMEGYGSSGRRTGKGSSFKAVPRQVLAKSSPHPSARIGEGENERCDMEFWSFLSRSDNILGILTTVFSGYAAFRLKQQASRIRELAKQTPRMENFKGLLAAHDGVKSSAPMALAVCLLPTGGPIRNSIETFLRAKGWSMP